MDYLESLSGFVLPKVEDWMPKPAPPPSFPTLLGLAEASTESPPPVERGLFQEVLRGRADILLEDAQLAKEKYDEETRELLIDLYTGRKKLDGVTADQRRLLDDATLALLSRPEVNHGITRRDLKPGNVPQKRREISFDGPEAVSPRGEDGLPAFWWLKDS